MNLAIDSCGRVVEIVNGPKLLKDSCEDTQRPEDLCFKRIGKLGGISGSPLDNSAITGT